MKQRSGTSTQSTKTGGRLAWKYEFRPLVFESTGGVGRSARRFAKDLERHIRDKLCSSAEKNFENCPNKLLTAVNFAIQRGNGAMILAREPVEEKLTADELSCIRFSLARQKKKLTRRFQGALSNGWMSMSGR